MSRLIIQDSTFKDDTITFNEKTGVFHSFNLGAGTTPSQETRVKIRKEDVSRLITMLRLYEGGN